MLGVDRIAQSDVIQMFKEMGALSKETAITRTDMRKHLNIRRITTTIEHPLLRLVKAGDVLYEYRKPEGKNKAIKHFWLNPNRPLVKLL